MKGTLFERWQRFLSKLGVTLLPYQQSLALELLTFPTSAKITQCRQSGKSFVLGLVIYFLGYVEKWDVVITAPTLSQTWHIMKNVHKAQNRIRARVGVFANRYSLDLRGRGTITCLSGSETASVEGPSAHLVVVDEHQDCHAAHIAEIFVPMLSWTEGLFWTCGIGGGPGSVAERGGCTFEWTLPWQEVIKVKPGYERLVNAARAEMLPEEFAAHYECRALDLASRLLVPMIDQYGNTTWEGAQTTIGLDWGKRMDSSVATVVDRVEGLAYITGWLIPTGTYDQQIDTLEKWLKEEVEYDTLIAETNGVGDGCTDILLKQMKDKRGFDSGVHPLNVDQAWKTKQAKTIHQMAGNKTLRYNADHAIAGPFVKDLTAVEYKMLDTDHVKCTHSDFLSSLMLALHKTSSAYL